MFASSLNPGFIEPGHDFLDILRNVHPCEMCPDCQVLRTPRSRHCAICNRCVERFDHHCPWLNNCVGIGNHNAFLFFLVFLTLIFLTILTSNVISSFNWCDFELDTCPLEIFCYGCNWGWLTYIMIVYTTLITLFFLLPVGYLCVIQISNYTMNKTTNERFARTARTMSAVSDLDGFSSSYDSNTRSSNVKKDEATSSLLNTTGSMHKSRGCLGNCTRMCCYKGFPTQ